MISVSEAILSTVLAAPAGGAGVAQASPHPETFAEGIAALGIGDWIAIVLLLGGVSLCTLSAVGILRMPDLYTRMQASAKAGTLGVACIALATAFHFGSIGVAVEVLMITVFIFLTSPTAAYLIARASYFVEVPIWKQTQYDDLHGGYSDDHRLINLPGTTGPRRPSVARVEGEPEAKDAQQTPAPRRATG